MKLMTCRVGRSKEHLIEKRSKKCLFDENHWKRKKPMLREREKKIFHIN